MKFIFTVLFLLSSIYSMAQTMYSETLILEYDIKQENLTPEQQKQIKDFLIKNDGSSKDMTVIIQCQSCQLGSLEYNLGLNDIRLSNLLKFVRVFTDTRIELINAGKGKNRQCIIYFKIEVAEPTSRKSVKKKSAVI